MRIRFVIAGALLMTTPIVAQESPPIVQRPVATEKILRPAGNPELYEVALDGKMYVDWPLVERMATVPRGHSQQAVAQMMLAVRDGKSKDFSSRR